MYTHLSFDCYGTLIDWERGILDFFKSIANKYSANLTSEDILRLYTNFESQEEEGDYRPYKEILRSVYLRFGQLVGFEISQEEEYDLANSVKIWPAFPDSPKALQSLQQKYKLVIISNIDDDLFEHSQALLQVKFDHIFTAFQMKSYKPSTINFNYVQEKLSLDKKNWLHVAQSLYHDHKPAMSLGIDTVRINRPSIMGDQGLAPIVDVKPKKVYRSLEEFASNI